MASEIKPIYGTERTKLSEVLPLDTPFSIFVFPTTYCNFKCVYCAHSMGHNKMKEAYDFIPETMSMEVYEKFIFQMKQFPKKLKMLSLTGQGEPLINKNLPLMVRMAKEANIAERVEIISNGALLTPELSNALIEAGLDTLRISLQGITSDKYQEICGVGIDFDKYMENIRYFYKAKKQTKLYVKIMDVALAKEEEQEFYKLFEECSDRMYIEKMLPAYDGVSLTKNMQVDYDRYGRKHEKRKVCPLPFFMLGIFPNGDVEPCDTIYKPIVLGNINDGLLLDMWNGPLLKKFWREQLKGNRYENKRCAVCCAPDDVSHPEDVLDNEVEVLLTRIDSKTQKSCGGRK
ncbi:radical SAM protein [Sporanaerobium hydrogeniformans]|uniref:Radical SAM protein n=1 Tax=Sporanaerobium hydrogeniformans TaxID=3072179 RepID=A0AC61DDU6_9FIRM|nr:radical SAM protein [Sporanaerobium hydrogeniformans]PHV71349.1 radical SAM protein [Sporanaerobium hydrogeniformans]